MNRVVLRREQSSTPFGIVGMKILSESPEQLNRSLDASQKYSSANHINSAAKALPLFCLRALFL
jgi:hypothetical protein